MLKPPVFPFALYVNSEKDEQDKQEDNTRSPNDEEHISKREDKT